MFADASALCSMLTDETDARDLLETMRCFEKRITSPLAIWETVIAVARITNFSIRDTQRIVTEYLVLLNIQVLPVVPEISALAVEAFDRYGKGRHPADLNFGDCFSYACARHYRVPLLFKGGDFVHTDIERARSRP